MAIEISKEEQEFARFASTTFATWGFEHTDKLMKKQMTRKQYIHEMLLLILTQFQGDAQKELMLRQLQDSMKYDCQDKDDRYYDHVAPKDEWLATHIECCQRDIDYYKEKIVEDEEYVREANEYFKGLYALLDAAEPIK